MLTYLSTWLHHHARAAASSLQWMLHKPFTSTLTISVIAVTLALPALFWLLITNVSSFIPAWQQQQQISLYLKTGLTKEQQDTFLLQVRALNTVESAALKSPAQGMAALQAQEGMKDVMNFLPENPLPPVIEVHPYLHDNDTLINLKQLQHVLQQSPEVDTAKIDIEWVSRLHAILDLAARVVYAITILLAMAVFLIIVNTLRFTIYHRHEEILVLKLIGADASYIIRPFLYTGVWYALVGACMALLTIELFLLSLRPAIKQLTFTYQLNHSLMALSWREALFFVLSAVSLGWFAAFLSVKRQLASIEPTN